MRRTTTFHPEWGCLAPAPSLIRLLRTVFIATAVGAIAGGGVVFALVDRSAEEPTSVAERTMAQPQSVAERLLPATPPSLGEAQTAQLNLHTGDQSDAGPALPADGHRKGPATKVLSVSSPARPTIVASPGEIRMASGDPVETATIETAVATSPGPQLHMANGDSAETAVAPSPSAQAHRKHIAQREREKPIARRANNKELRSASRQGRHSLSAHNEPNILQKLLAGLTAAVDHVRPPATSTKASARAHGNGASAANT